MRSNAAPGPWLRLAALGGAAATLVAVVSGTLGPGCHARAPLRARAAAAGGGRGRRVARAPTPCRSLVRGARALRARGARDRIRRARGAGRRRVRRRTRLVRAVLPRRAGVLRSVARLRHPDEAADHDACCS